MHHWMTHQPRLDQHNTISLTLTASVPPPTDTPTHTHLPTYAHPHTNRQALVGDPASGSGKTPQTQWMPGWTKWYYPEITAIIDLGALYHVTSVWGWHQYGGAHLELSFATDVLHPSLQMELCTQAPCPNLIKGWEQSWVALANVSTPARYVMVRLYEPVSDRHPATLHPLSNAGRKLCLA